MGFALRVWGLGGTWMPGSVDMTGGYVLGVNGDGIRNWGQW